MDGLAQLPNTYLRDLSLFLFLGFNVDKSHVEDSVPKLPLSFIMDVTVL
jgi:hypothetical protein